MANWNFKTTSTQSKAATNSVVASSLPWIWVDTNFANKSVEKLTTPKAWPVAKEGYKEFVKPFKPQTKANKIQEKFGSFSEEVIWLWAPKELEWLPKNEYTIGKQVVGKYNASIFTQDLANKYEKEMGDYDKRLNTLYINLKNKNSKASQKFIATYWEKKYKEYVDFQNAKESVYSQAPIYTKEFAAKNKELIWKLKVDDSFKSSKLESFGKGILLDTTIWQVVSKIGWKLYWEDTLMQLRAADEKGRELMAEGKYSENVYSRIGWNFAWSLPVYLMANSAIVSSVSSAWKYFNFAKNASDFIKKAPVLSEAIMDNSVELVEYWARKALWDKNYTTNDLLLWMGIASTTWLITWSFKSIKLDNAESLASEMKASWFSNSEIKDAVLRTQWLVSWGDWNIKELISWLNLQKESEVPTKITKSNIQKYIFDRTWNVTSSNASKRIADSLNYLDSKIKTYDSTDKYFMARSQLVQWINQWTIRTKKDADLLIDSLDIKIPKSKTTREIDDLEELVLNPRFDNDKATQLIKNNDFNWFKRYVDELRLPEEEVADIWKVAAPRGKFKKLANEVTIWVKKSQKAWDELLEEVKKLPTEQRKELRKIIRSAVEEDRQKWVKSMVEFVNKQIDDEIAAIRANSKLKLKQKDKLIQEANTRRIDTLKKARSAIRTTNDVKKEYTRTVTDFMKGKWFRWTAWEKRAILNKYISKISSAKEEKDIQNLFNEFSEEVFEVSRDRILKSIYEKTNKYITKSKTSNTNIDINVLKAISAFIDENTKAINNWTLDNLVNIERQIEELIKYGRTKYTTAKEASVSAIRDVALSSYSKWETFTLWGEKTLRELEWDFKTTLLDNIKTKWNKFWYSVDIYRWRFYDNVFWKNKVIKEKLYDNILYSKSKMEAFNQRIRTFILDSARHAWVFDEIRKNPTSIPIFLNVRNWDIWTVLNSRWLKYDIDKKSVVQLTHSSEIGNFRSVTEDDIMKVYTSILHDKRYSDLIKKVDDISYDIWLWVQWTMERTSNKSFDLIKWYYWRFWLSSIWDVDANVWEINRAYKRVNDSMTKSRVLEDWVDIDLDFFSYWDKVTKNHVYYMFMKEPLDEAAKMITILRKWVKLSDTVEATDWEIDNAIEQLYKSEWEDYRYIDYDEVFDDEEVSNSTHWLISNEVFRQVTDDIKNWAKWGRQWNTELAQYLNQWYRIFSIDALWLNAKSAMLQTVTIQDAKWHLWRKFFKDNDSNYRNALIANELSGLLENRTQFNETFFEFAKKNTFNRLVWDVEQHAFKWMKIMDWGASRQIWFAAYRKYLVDNNIIKVTDDLDLTNPLHNNEAAVKYADINMTEIMTDNNFVWMNKNMRGIIAKIVFPFVRPTINRMQMLINRYPKYNWEQRLNMMFYTLSSMAQSIVITQSYWAIKIALWAKKWDTWTILEQYLASFYNGEEVDKEKEAEGWVSFLYSALLQELLGWIPWASSLIKWESKYDWGWLIDAIVESAIDVKKSIDTPYDTAWYMGAKVFEFWLPWTLEEFPKFFTKKWDAEYTKFKSTATSAWFKIGELTPEEIERIKRSIWTKELMSKEKASIIEKFKWKTPEQIKLILTDKDIEYIKANYSSPTKFFSEVNKKYVESKIKWIWKEKAIELIKSDDTLFQIVKSMNMNPTQFIALSEKSAEWKWDIDLTLKWLSVDDIFKEVIFPMEADMSSAKEEVAKVKELYDKKIITKSDAEELVKRIFVIKIGQNY